jgi:hypothetical protein
LSFELSLTIAVQLTTRTSVQAGVSTANLVLAGLELLIMSQTTLAITSIVAIIVGPIFALAIQRWADHRRELRREKLWVFRTLMAYRATRLNPNFVQALNAIDVIFHGSSQDEKDVRTAWKVLLDHLNTDQKSENAVHRQLDLLVALLARMGKCLGYDFDEVYLKRQAYQPVGLANMEEEQNEVRASLLQVLRGDRRVPIAVFPDDFAPLRLPPGIPPPQTAPKQQLPVPQIRPDAEN